MQSLSHKEFNRRWAKAKKGSTTPMTCKVSPSDINITLEGILDNYQRQLERAQTAHAVDGAQCQAICKAITDLKTAIQPVSAALKPYLKT